MNQTFGQLDPEPVHRNGFWSNRLISDFKALSIDAGEEEPYTILVDSDGHSVVTMTKDEAIKMAEAILTEFRVPFCNRVKGSGTSAV